MSKGYYVDFSSWVVNAESGKAAVDKAIEYMKQGKVPAISGVELFEGGDTEEIIETEWGGENNG